MLDLLHHDVEDQLGEPGGPLDPEAGDWTACELCDEEIDAGRIRCERCLSALDPLADNQGRPGGEGLARGLYPNSPPGVFSEENDDARH